MDKKLPIENQEVSYSLKTCPDIETLIAYREGRLGGDPLAIEAHLMVCPHCSQEIDLLMESSEALPAWSPKPVPKDLQAAIEEIGKQRPTLPARGGAVGDIYATQGVVTIPGQDQRHFLTGQPRYVVLTLDAAKAYDIDFPDVRVSPISFSTDEASEYDLVVEMEESPFGCEFMVECWNDQPMLKANLGKLLSGLSNTALKDVGQLVGLYLEGVTPKGIVGRTGTAFTVDDPRLAFQESEREATAYLRVPIAALLEQWETEEPAVSILDMAKEYVKEVFFGAYKLLEEATKPADQELTPAFLRTRFTRQVPHAKPHTKILEVTLSPNVYRVVITHHGKEGLRIEIEGEKVESPAPLQVSIFKSGEENPSVSGSTDSNGRGAFALEAPRVPAGDYKLTLQLGERVEGLDFRIP